jgi:RNA polymerase sigma factor (TIGR02999 family)
MGLVNDAYVKVLGQSRPGFENRRHLFGAFARAMHEVLIDAARKRRAAKRGGGARPVALDMVQVAAPMHGVPALDLAEAIPALEADDPRAAEIVRLKCLAGLSDAMLAEVLGVSERTVQRDWTYAKAFIRRHLAEAGSEEA